MRLRRSTSRNPGPLRRHWQNRELIIASTKRDIAQPYAGQVLGGYWIVVQPLFFVALLTIVFNFVFGARFGGGETERDYTTFILAGLVPWQVFAVSLSRSTGEIVGAANIVKQVVFPIETLPVKGVLAATPSLLVGLLFQIGYHLVRFGSIPVTAALVPFLVVMQLMWMIGAAAVFSAVTVFFRDLKDLMNLFVTASVYLLPIVYLPGNVPGPLQPIIFANPFSVLVYAYQDALYFGRFEHPGAWVALTVMSVASFYVGHAAFRQLRPFMGNVL